MRNGELSKAIAILDKHVPDPSAGLPQEVFFYISRTTPLANVDLLIKDEKGRTLLSWRNDRDCGRGWHLPGGIVRIGETLETRIKKVAETEIGADVRLDANPIAINQIINPERKVRRHFISLLYKCFLSSMFVPVNRRLSAKDNGYLKWHDFCPDDLLRFHEIYRKYI